MRALFADYEEACDNTLLIAERAAVEIEFGNAVLPSFPTPPGHDEDSFLRELCIEGAKERYGMSPGPEVLERIEFELGVIKTMGFSAYFLIVWDLVRYARSRGIRVGPGRGSAAGSCVAYCLRIVDIDPIKYDLLFERFLNPGRKQMPDIDMDFDSRYRGEMIKYAAERYGWDHVAQIVTFSTIKARAAVRDSARVLGYPYLVGDKIAKLMPPLIMGRDTPLRACFEKVTGHEDGYKMATELRTLYETDPDAKRVIDVARGLEGLRRQDGIHAAAVVITREPLTEYLPIQRKPEAGGKIEDAPIVTQYEMHGVEDLGLLKMDFLGLRNLDVLEIALDLIAESTGARPDIDRVPLDDAATFDLLRRGDTVGVFQLEGGPMRALLRSLAPTEFEDVAALIALYRPGPMAQNWHNEYADRKNGRKPVTYPHDDLREVLEPTYGLMIYQEQLMRVAQRLAGYSLEEADNLRKATGKKIRALIAKERTKFVEGCVANGHTEAFGNELLRHDRAVRRLLVQQVALVRLRLRHVPDRVAQGELPARVLRRAAHVGQDQQGPDRRLPQRVPPDGHRGARPRRQRVGLRLLGARSRPRPRAGDIRFGLSAVRNVGEGVVAHIVAARQEGGPFTDFYDFCDRVDPSVLNKRCIESLAKAGAFDSVGHPRQGLVFVHETIIETVLGRRRNEAEGQFDLFSAVDDPAPEAVVGHRTEIPDTEFPKSQRLTFEKEMLGLYVSDHPMMGAERALRKYTDGTLAELRDGREGDMRTVGGIVTALNRRYTKRGDLMATFMLEDLGAALEVMVFPKTMEQYGHLLEDDAIVVIKGRLDVRDDTPKIIAMEVVRPELSVDTGPPVRVKVKLNVLSDSKVGQLKDILSEHPGDSPVYVHLESPEKTTVLRLGDDHLVDAGTGLFAELRILLGADCIT